MSAVCAGAFLALWSEFRRARLEVEKSIENADTIAKGFVTEHNSMAKKVMELSESVNGLKMSVGLNRTK
jgi:hypothetical protein